MVEKNNDKPKKLIIFNNKKIQRIKRGIVPIINNNKISHLFQINLFNYDGIITPSKNTPSYSISRNKKHNTNLIIQI